MIKNPATTFNHPYSVILAHLRSQHIRHDRSFDSTRGLAIWAGSYNHPRRHFEDYAGRRYSEACWFVARV